MTRPLILAIESDAHQASQLASVARRLDVELVVAESVERALESFSARLPDLILTPALLSRREELILTERLRELGEAAAHIQTLTIPILEASEPPSPRGGMLSILRRRTTSQATPPESVVETFAGQIALYLQGAAESRPGEPAVQAPAPATPEALVDLPPVVQPDEWSYFDPKQYRFAALIAKLDEIAEGNS